MPAQTHLRVYTRVQPVAAPQQQGIHSLGRGFGRCPRLGLLLPDQPAFHLIDNEIRADCLPRLLAHPGKTIDSFCLRIDFTEGFNQVRLRFDGSLIPLQSAYVVGPVHAQFLR